MHQSEAEPEQTGSGLDPQATVPIDPLRFFQYATTSDERWRELIGLTVQHCIFGRGTIRKIEGEYLYVDLPERQGKKQLTEFGLDSFRRGFFSDLQIQPALLEKIMAAAAAPAEPPPLVASTAAAPREPAKRTRKSTPGTKAAKKRDRKSVV